MAIDELLTRGAAAPLLRVYRWSEPTVSFGYFGEYEAVAARWPGRPLTRRWTGGGEVPHDNDFTYTVIVPRSDSFARLPVRESYRLLHEAVAALIPGATLAAADAPENAACFARPVVADVIHDGRKIAGAAQRRGTFGLLHQGSVQGLVWPDGLAESLAAALGKTWSTGAISPEILSEAEALALEKYATDPWLRRR
jgi:lipoate-protein ligase A